MNFAYTVGRFQPLHNGHIDLIQYMIDNFKHHILFIGSTNVLCKDKNPLTFEERKLVIQKEFPSLKILPIDDFNNLKIWQNELNKKIKNEINNKSIENVFFLTSSKNNDLKLRNEWMSDFNHKVLSIKGKSNLSATKIREAIKFNKIDFIKDNLPYHSYSFILEKYKLKELYS